jgi:hypothetical protein
MTHHLVSPFLSSGEFVVGVTITLRRRFALASLGVLSDMHLCGVRFQQISLNAAYTRFCKYILRLRPPFRHFGVHLRTIKMCAIATLFFVR